MIHLKSWNISKGIIELTFEASDEACEDVLDALETQNVDSRTCLLTQILSAHVPEYEPLRAVPEELSFDDWAIAEAARIKEQNGP
jgi:hypothetical protein